MEKKIALLFLLLPWFCHAHKAKAPASLFSTNTTVLLDVPAQIIEFGKEPVVGEMKWELTEGIPKFAKKFVHSGLLIASAWQPAMALFHFVPYFFGSQTAISFSTQQGPFPLFDISSYIGLEKLLKRAIQIERESNHEDPYSFDRRIRGVKILVNRRVGAGSLCAKGELPYIFDLFDVETLEVFYEHLNFGYYADQSEGGWYRITNTFAEPFEVCTRALTDKGETSSPHHLLD